MAPSRALSNLIDRLWPFVSFAGILQSEEYESHRYLRWLPRFFFRRNFLKRNPLVYTTRAKLLLLASCVLWLGSLVLSLSMLSTNWLTESLVLIGWSICIPFFILLGNLVTVPLFRLMHARRQEAVRRLIASRSGLKIITIAGSYGKTTTKNFIYDLVRFTYRTQLIPGNINTTSGIAAWLQKNLAPSTQLLIVETDAYAPGEIAATVRMTPGDVAVITNVGDQHLERFRSRERLARTLRESFEDAKPGATLICDAACATALGTESYLGKTLHIVPPPDRIIYAGKDIAADRFSRSNQSNLSYALAAAEALSIPEDLVLDTVTKLAPPDRRQRPASMHGYDAIDDSYNISFTTATAGITAARTAADAAGKKLLVVTAGIPELGPDDLDKNRELGKLLALHADHAAVLNSILAADIAAGVGDAERYTRYADWHAFLASAHDDFPPSEWVVLFQPELNDLYY